MGLKFDFKSRHGKVAEVRPPEAPRPVDLGPATDEPSVLWSGHLYDYSGYGKANREILFRVANALRVSVLRTGLEDGLVSVDLCTRRRIDAYRDVPVNEKAPLLRFFGPDYVGDQKRYRICWTMMETYKIHYEMVRMVNQSFDELWTPTEWGRQVFVESGVKIPSYVYPLGVNSAIYRPIQDAKLPKCRLLTTSQAGAVGIPSGFVFFSVGLPSFRKGFDVLVEAFDLAFRGREDVHLVLGITHSLPEWNKQVYQQFAGRNTRIWTLEGRYNEHEMARIYSAVGAYVSASRGEGWNLPVCEAAACGIPVIAPDNTSHPEVTGGGAYLIPTEGLAVHEEGARVSPWYVGVPFAVFGKKSVATLADQMRAVSEGAPGVRHKAEGLLRTVRTKWTWDAVAHRVTDRLLEVQL